MLVLLEATVDERPSTARCTTLSGFIASVTEEESAVLDYGVKPEIKKEVGTSASSNAVLPSLGPCPSLAGPPFACMLAYIYIHIHTYIFTHIYTCIFYIRPMYAIIVSTHNARGDPLECV